MEKSPSNPMSEYEFAELPEENVEEDVLPNDLLQRMEQNLSMVLASYDLSSEVLSKIIQSGLKYSQLSSLTVEDLELFGIEDRQVQDNMLSEFNQLDGQDDHFELIMRQFATSKKAKDQEMSVIDLIQNQLSSMNTLLAATIIKVGAARTSSSAGIVINKKFNSPQVVVEMLEQLTEHGNQMTDLLNKLKNNKEMDKQKKIFERRNVKRNAGLGLLVLSSLILGFAIAQKVRFGKN